MLEVRNLNFSYSGESGETTHAVRGVSFSLKKGEFYSLLGPSGCGKSTTLRCIAGLETPSSGSITIGDNVVYDAERRLSVPADRRSIGMVFQSYAVWPHMSVLANVMTPLVVGRRRLNRPDAREKAMKALAMVGLAGFADRPAPYLSGGQQQRVAVARALALEPDVLLLDEPLSNLDAKLREHMREEIRHLVTRLNLTTLYVTHDQAEALAMSDRFALMGRGQIVQEGNPKEVYLRPTSAFVAEFLGKSNLIHGEILGAPSAELATISTPVGELQGHLPPTYAGSKKVALLCRPESVELRSEMPAEDNAVKVSMRSSTFLGDHIEYVVVAPCNQPLLIIQRGPHLPGDWSGYAVLPKAECRIVEIDEQLSE